MSEALIDCEYHVAAPDLQLLLPYMEKSWAARFVRSRFSLPLGREHPGGGSLTEGSSLPDPATAGAALAAGTRAALLVPHQVMPVAGWTDTLLCSVYATALNRYVREHWIPADRRFRMAIAISPHEPELAADEIDRYGEDVSAAAIVMPLLATHLGQTHYRPIFKAAARHRLPVIVHPSGREGTIVGTPVLSGMGPRHAGEYHSLIWQAAVTNIASLVYDGVFIDLPDLRVVFAGFGFEWLPGVLWHLDMEWRSLRIDIPWVTDPPSVYVARHIRIVIDDLGLTPPEASRQIANMLAEGLLMWGSNSPFATNSAAEVLDAMPEKLRAKVAFGNAAETFGSRLLTEALA